jgi:ribonuclease HI
VTKRRKPLDAHTRVEGGPCLPLSPTGLLVAADASAMRRHDGVQRVGWGFVTEHGLYALGGGVLRGADRAMPSLIVEMVAVWEAMMDPRIPRGRTVTVLTDCAAVPQLVDSWRTGRDRVPRGYAGGWKGTIMARLAAAVRSRPEVRVQWVRGHDVHQLNVCADHLAGVGRGMALGRSKAQARTWAEALVFRHTALHHAREGYPAEEAG